MEHPLEAGIPQDSAMSSSWFFNTLIWCISSQLRRGQRYFSAFDLYFLEIWTVKLSLWQSRNYVFQMAFIFWSFDERIAETSFSNCGAGVGMVNQSPISNARSTPGWPAVCPHHKSVISTWYVVCSQEALKYLATRNKLKKKRGLNGPGGNHNTPDTG
jgi:hypothetical protein